MERECNACHNALSDDNFPLNSKGLRGRGNKCNPCGAKYQQNKRSSNPLYQRSVKFKVSEKEIADVLSIGSCEICGLPGAKHVDHNHDTGEIRGLLCSTCNSGLGLFKDCAAILTVAANYLEKRYGKD